MWKKRIISSLWVLLGIVTAGLFIAAMQHKQQALCSGLRVDIEGIEGHVFIDENSIVKLMKANGAGVGKTLANTDVRKIEAALERDPWIKNAELYFDSKDSLHATIEEREPLARIFTINGNSFYIDSSLRHLPLSNDYSARVPMFTSFTSDRIKMSKPDSVLLNDVKKVAQQIQTDSFWMAQVAQINITPQKTFELVPVLGNQKILIGNADSLDEKFSRLLAFYKQVWAKAGFEKYETIDVQYKGQVVAARRGAPKPEIDSALALRLTAAMRNDVDIVKDSADVRFGDAQLLVEAKKDTTVTPAVTTSAHSLTNKKETKKPQAKPVASSKPVVKKQQPKTVMPKQKKH